MKNLKLVVFTATATLAIFMMVFYSSCRNPCKNVVCLNGGACNNGNCICPTGYTGNRCQDLAITEIDYTNNTYTTANVTLNNTNYTISPGATLAIKGSYGDEMSGNFTVAGAYGLSLTFALDNTFPASGILDAPLDIGNDYFFLEVTNNTGVGINEIKVNNTVDFPSIPSDGSTHVVGYYPAYQYNNIAVYLNNGNIINYNNQSIPNGYDPLLSLSVP